MALIRAELMNQHWLNSESVGEIRASLTIASRSARDLFFFDLSRTNSSFSAALETLYRLGIVHF